MDLISYLAVVLFLLLWSVGDFKAEGAGWLALEGCKSWVVFGLGLYPSLGRKEGFRPRGGMLLLMEDGLVAWGVVEAMRNGKGWVLSGLVGNSALDD